MAVPVVRDKTGLERTARHTVHCTQLLCLRLAPASRCHAGCVGTGSLACRVLPQDPARNSGRPGSAWGQSAPAA